MVQFVTVKPISRDYREAWIERRNDVEARIRAELSDFVVENFLFGDAERTPADNESLVDGGIVDSTGILEMIEFLESQFGIEVEDTETVPANLDSIASLTAFVLRKRAHADSADVQAVPAE
jgi:acyl carrier protein